MFVLVISRTQCFSYENKQAFTCDENEKKDQNSSINFIDQVDDPIACIKVKVLIC